MPVNETPSVTRSVNRDDISQDEQWALDFSCPNHADVPALELGRSLQSMPRMIYVSNHALLAFPEGSWVPTRRSDIIDVLKSPELFSSDPGHFSFSSIINETWRLPPIEYDPPQHSKFRKALQPVFTADQVAISRDKVKMIADEILQSLFNGRRCEVIGDFARPFAMQVLLTYLGLPLATWSHMAALHTTVVHDSNRDNAASAVNELKLLFANILKSDAHSSGTMIHRIRQLRDSGDWTIEESVAGCMLMFIAGFDTMVAMIGLQVRYLAMHLDRQSQLRANPGLIRGAVHEMIRIFPIVNAFRRATHETELAGVKIRRGDWVLVSTPIATADDLHVDDCTIINFNCPRRSDISFGYGIHRCLGLHLAKLELEVAIHSLLATLPAFHITALTNSPVVAGRIHSVESLDISW